jgi:hypothetical protein
MKSPLLVLPFLTTVALADVAGDSVKIAALHPRLTAVIEERFPYQPLKPEGMIDSIRIPIEGEVVVLPAFKVTDNLPRGLERAILEAEKRESREAFSWANGGTIVKKVGKRVTFELKLGSTPEKGFYFLNLSW